MQTALYLRFGMKSASSCFYLDGSLYRSCVTLNGYTDRVCRR